LKPVKDRLQLSLLEGEEYEYFSFVTNTEMPSENFVIAYEKRVFYVPICCFYLSIAEKNHFLHPIL